MKYNLIEINENAEKSTFCIFNKKSIFFKMSVFYIFGKINFYIFEKNCFFNGKLISCIFHKKLFFLQKKCDFSYFLNNLHF